MKNALRWGGVSQERLYGNPEKIAISKDAWRAGSCGTARNDAGTPRQKWHKTHTGSSADVLVRAAACVVGASRRLAL